MYLIKKYESHFLFVVNFVFFFIFVEIISLTITRHNLSYSEQYILWFSRKLEIKAVSWPQIKIQLNSLDQFNN